jgi:hypothetical protein
LQIFVLSLAYVFSWIFSFYCDCLAVISPLIIQVEFCDAELPPPELLDCLSKELRRRLGLRLFNLDIIREGGAGNRYYVIDINYFPGYGKMPDYEFVFTDFLLSLARSKGQLVVGGGGAHGGGSGNTSS